MSISEKTAQKAVTFIIASVFALVIGIAVYSAGVKRIQVEAVEHGYAEWVSDERGTTEFKWKNAQEEE